MPEFITSNPAQEAFERGQKLHTEEMQARQQMDANALAQVENRAAAPSRLRQIEANADLAGTNARVARETAPYKIGGARLSYETAGQLAPVKVEEAQLGLRRVRADTGIAELQGFFKSLELLNAGDVEGARHVARQTGQEIPEPIIKSSTLRQQVTRLAEEAETRYPNSPRRQQEYLTAATQGLVDEIQGQQNRQDPAYPYNVPGAPMPAETSTDKDRRPLQFEVIRDAARALGYDETTSFNLARGQKPTTESEIINMARQLTTIEMPSSDFRTRPEDRRARLEEIVDELRSTLGGQAVPAQRAAPPVQGDLTAQEFVEGQTATNPRTGEQVIFQGGQWVPLQ